MSFLGPLLFWGESGFSLASSSKRQLHHLLFGESSVFWSDLLSVTYPQLLLGKHHQRQPHLSRTESEALILALSSTSFELAHEAPRSKDAI